jgi:hypothetical protein
MIQDEITPKKPLFKMIFLIPGGLRREMIQDEILFQRIDNATFTATGGGYDTRRDIQAARPALSCG